RLREDGETTALREIVDAEIGTDVVDSPSEQLPISLSILEALREPALLLDPQMRIVAANQASLLFFQQEAVAIAGRPFFDHLPLAGDLGDVRDHLEKLFSGADKTP